MSIKGLHYLPKRRPGKLTIWYVYAWRGGPQIMSHTGGAKKPALTPEALQLYAAAIVDARAVKKETMAGLLRDWRKSTEWQAMAATTRTQWFIRTNLIEDKWGDTPLSIWSDPRMVAKIVDWRDSCADRPREADYRVSVLRSLLEWGRLRGRVTVNVASGIPQLYRGGNRAEIIWTDDDLARFLAKAPQPVSDAIRLAAFTGMRRADLAGLKWTEVGDKIIRRVTLKSSRRKPRTASVPIFPALKDLLDELRNRYRRPDAETVLVNHYGRGWSPDGLGQQITRYAQAAGIVHEDGRAKHLHDVRGTFATKLILAGFTDQQAADVLGWAPEQVSTIRRVYVDQERVVVQMAERIQAAAVNRPVNRQGNDGEK